MSDYLLETIMDGKDILRAIEDADSAQLSFSRTGRWPQDLSVAAHQLLKERLDEMEKGKSDD